jgi:hypothetical protein
MFWYHWLAIISALICAISCLIHGIRLIRLGKPTDYSQQKGNFHAAVRYSFTGAMSPIKKESAYLHFPTYISGLLYHLGTFVSLFLFVLLISGVYISGLLVFIITTILMITGLCGMGIFIKRIFVQKMRALSNPDDYISNLLVTFVQFLTALVLIRPEFTASYFILVSILLLYLPLGKLKHVVYFFAARYHLGFFYGWRGVWPPKYG